MPDEYDAFGRKKDDAGLGDLGWGATGDTPPVSTTSATPTPTTPPREFQTVTPVSTGRVRSGRNPGVLLLQIAVLAIIVGAIALAVTAGKQANDSVRDTLNGFKTLTTDDGGTSVDDGGDDVPKQVRAASFFTPKGLRAGLRILAKEQPGRISNFSMRKDRINIQVIRGGKNHIVQLSAGAEAPEESTVTAASSTSDTISYEELNATAPERLMKRGQRAAQRLPEAGRLLRRHEVLGHAAVGHLLQELEDRPRRLPRALHP